jgi:PLP dependent protein
MSIADNLRRVEERIARAAESAGRRANEITLVGVTKYVGAREAAELVAAGCHNLGESRPQELWKKHDDVQRAGAPPTPSSRPIHWHLIGHLQRNKIARTLPLVSLIHSVDSERLLDAINDAYEPVNHLPPTAVLLEVNTSGESAKHGLALNEVEPLLAAAPSYPNVAIRGLMTMPALEGGEAIAANNFASLRQLRDRLKPIAPDCVTLNELSMGMSADFEVAIQEGATIVRVGSALWE